jgi:hypothetical protein
MRASHRVRELLGFVTGTAGAPASEASTRPRARSASHAAGSVYSADVRPAKKVKPPFVKIARDLSGHGVARFSSGIFPQELGWPDLLGFAIRFRTDPAGPEPLAGEQDLFLVTASRLWSLPLDAVRTDQSDYLRNTFHGLAPFEIDRVADMRVRLVPLHANGVGIDRDDRLRNAVAQGLAKFRLEVAPADDPGRVEPIVEIDLVEALAIDEHALRFSPFRTGLGLRPQGFIHFLRPATYGRGRAARG